LLSDAVALFGMALRLFIAKKTFMVKQTQAQKIMLFLKVYLAIIACICYNIGDEKEYSERKGL